MSKLSTQDYVVKEEEANYWLSVFDALPDTLFSNTMALPNQLILANVKAFARAYQPLNVMELEGGIVIN
ncbi:MULTISPECIES: hypothetical protein [unclassified Carboxylicivirga]|uniref:hypothetical protein n=1 Tax=Carboxylicivirga TaxID=1628153 RepID=UPI003D347889